MDFTFAVIGTPVPQGSHRVYGNKVVPVNAEALYSWRHDMATGALLACPNGWNPDLSVSVHALFTYVRPRSHYTPTGNLRKGAPDDPTGRSDLDKLARALGDALSQSGVLRDDSQIVEFLVRKRYAAKEGVAAWIASGASVPAPRCGCIACAPQPSGTPSSARS